MSHPTSNPATVAAPAGQYSHAISVPTGAGRLLFISGQVALDPSGTLIGPDDMQAQTEQVFRNIGAILEANGAAFADIVKTTIFVTDMARRADVAEVRRRYLGDHAPTSTLVEMSALASPEWLGEIEVVAAPRV